MNNELIANQVEKLLPIKTQQNKPILTKSNTLAYSRAKTILVVGILDIVVCIAMITTFALLFTFTMPNLDSARVNIKDGDAVILWIIAMTPLLAFVLNITGSVLILTSKFNDDWLDTFKIVWGILSLSLIGPFGIIIFAGIAMNKLKTTKLNNKTTDDIIEPIV